MFFCELMFSLLLYTYGGVELLQWEEDIPGASI